MFDKEKFHEQLERLTESQRVAVTHETGPLMVLAGPGSGKTRVVTTRVGQLIAGGVHSHRIVALTFTNKAAEEMKRRVAAMVGGHDVWISTFHRFCSFLLRRYAPIVGLDPNFSIYDMADSKRALQAVLEDADMRAMKVQPRQLLRAISNAKNRLVSPAEFADQAVSNVDVLAAEVYPLYQQRLLRSNAVDFDDLLVHVANMLTENAELRTKLDRAFEYLLVDEYQDTNLAQYRIIQALSQQHPNLTVTGDPDQSIYGWRGAHLSNVLDFERDFSDVQVVRLEENFRSTASIVYVADVVIANNQHRKPKSLIATKDEGEPVQLHRFTTGELEAGWIADTVGELANAGTAKLNDCAVLYRVNASSRLVEHALMDRGIPYRVINGVEFYQRKEIKDVLAYLNLINNPRNDAAFLRVINEPKDVLAYLNLINNPRNDAAFLRVINEPSRGVGPKNLERISRFAAQHECSLWEAVNDASCVATLSPRPQKTVRRFVQLMTDLMQPQKVGLGNFISRVIDDSGYGPALRDSESEQDHDRLENLRELIVAADTFETELQGEATLERFLEQKALVNETDDLDTAAQAVTLMTLHGAKGLEFPRVFLIGIEQGLLPHARTLDDPLQEEEERRLFFVGITRAQRHLYLTYADFRRRQDGVRRTVTSPFLTELPREALQMVHHHDDLAMEDCMEHSAGGGYVSPRRLPEVDLVSPLEAQTESRLGSESLPSRERRSPDAGSGPKLVTAASLLGGDSADAARPDPESFAADMLVTHPEFGHGKVLHVSGRGAKRIAKVVFFATATERSFVLAHSQLQPVQAP